MATPGTTSPSSGKKGRFSLERIPPGQRLTRDFPVRHLGPVPAFHPQSWEFRVLGYWEARGYSNTAGPWTEDRYAPSG